MRFSKPILRWGFPFLWLALTVGCSLAHWYAWGYPEQSDGTTGQLDALCKQVANAAQTLNAPFWFVAWFKVNRYVSFASAMAVNGVGFAFWLGTLAVLLLARTRLFRRRPCSEAAPSAEVVRVPSLSRRAFLTDSALVTGAACAGTVGAYSSFVTPWSLKLARYSIPVHGLPRALDGFRLVQITDTHLGPRIPASFIREAVELALSLRPDLFVLTGDYVHMGPTYIGPAAELFAPLTERRPWLVGAVGVLGNHDHYADAPAVTAAMNDIGIRMIDNHRLFIDGHDRDLAHIARRDDSLCIAGVGDFLEGVVDPVAAFSGVGPGTPRVLLSHNPDCAEIPGLVEPGSPRVDLMVCGHTHGGQVSLPLVGPLLIPSRHGTKYAHGLVRGPAFPVVISAGVGMSLIPVRVGVRPEIVEITLTRPT